MLEFTIAGEAQIARAFSRFTAEIKDLTEPFKEIETDFKEGQARQFDTGGNYGAGGWKPLSPATIKRKGHSRILVDSGLLMQSLTGTSPWTISDIRPLSLRMGTKIPYALYHQTGTSRTPQRKIIALPEEQKRQWVKIIQGHLVKQANKEFAGLAQTAAAGQKAVGSI